MHEKNGNDATIVKHSVEGHVVYFKNDYGFIKPDDVNFDDLFFHVRDVEPWCEGFVEFKGRVKEQHLTDDDGNDLMIPSFPGERVKFDIKDNNKMVGGKKGYKAMNIEILSEYKQQTFKKK